MQHRRVANARLWISGCSFSVECDTPAGLVGGQGVAVLERGLLGEDVLQVRAGLFGHLEHTGVGGCERQMRAGRRRDRAERIVGNDLNVMRLGPAGDLERLSESADQTEVDAGVVDQFLFDCGGESPLGEPLLAGGQWDCWCARAGGGRTRDARSAARPR